MKLHYMASMVLSLFLITACSNDESYAKKLILVSLKNNTAAEFVEFTRFDNKNACYEVTIRNYDGRQKTTFISLNRDSENNPEWNHWASTESLDECRKEFSR